MLGLAGDTQPDGSRSIRSCLTRPHSPGGSGVRSAVRGPVGVGIQARYLPGSGRRNQALPAGSVRTPRTFAAWPCRGSSSTFSPGRGFPFRVTTMTTSGSRVYFASGIGSKVSRSVWNSGLGEIFARRGSYQFT